MACLSKSYESRGFNMKGITENGKRFVYINYCGFTMKIEVENSKDEFKIACQKLREMWK